jgi:hypothetical protein
MAWNRIFSSGVLIVAMMISTAGSATAFALDGSPSPVPPSVLPPGTTLLPANIVQLIDTSNASWTPSAPDPAGLDYWPSQSKLLVVDSEVDEMPNYFAGKNVYLATTSGSLTGTCSTTSFTSEPNGVAINPNNNHIFFSSDAPDRVFELSLGGDGNYCTGDDSVTTTDVATLYGITDPEDVAYGNNTLFIADGAGAEVFSLPLGADGVLGGGDDGPLAQFDTAALGFHDLEGVAYNGNSGTLFIVSTRSTEDYLGETSLTGTLVHAYDLSFMGNASNMRASVRYAPGSQNPAVNHIYIASRGVDNNFDPTENDGKIWEVSIGGADQAPAVHAIRRADPNPTSLDSVRFNVIFTEAVTGVDLGDFSLAGTGITGASISGISNVGALYTVTVNTGAGLGTIQLRLIDNDSIRDSANKPLGGAGAGNGSFATGETYDVVHNTEIHIGVAQQGIYRVRAHESTTDFFASVNNGPVKFLNTNNAPMLAAERVIYKVNNLNTSFSEMMALPNSQLDGAFWLPWYNNVDLDTQLRFGRP